jgi:hypothetical protein
MKKMKKFFMFLCVVIMLFGIAGCPGDDAQFTSSTPSVVKNVGDNTSGVSQTSTASDDISSGSGGSTVPEPTTLALLGAGLIGLVGFGRKKFKK